LILSLGNHAQGAVFKSIELTDYTKVLERIEKLIGSVTGFNYGRLDIRSQSLESFANGDFQVLEVNGIDSLSTDIFDPSWSILDAYRQLFCQYSLLIDLAYEHKHQPMQFDRWSEILSKTWASEKELERNHSKVISLGLR
jgi:hypothetical protein